MSYKPIDSKELANHLLKHINLHTPNSLLNKARKLDINLEHIIELSIEKQIDNEKIVQLINSECKKKEQLIYYNLIDNFPILPVGIRDCYKKSM